MKVTILDLESGNLKSLHSAINFLGIKAKLSNKKEDIIDCTHLVLAGQGAFDSVMERIDKFELSKVIFESVIKNNKPILGICVGMQILFSESEEGNKKGLGFFKEKVLKLKNDEKNFHKVPNVGFHKLYSFKNEGIFKNLTNPYFYFTHSYAIKKISLDKINFSYTDHENKFISALEYKNICAVQFHPEKSQSSGLKILKNFFEKKK